MNFIKSGLLRSFHSLAMTVFLPRHCEAIAEAIHTKYIALLTYATYGNDEERKNYFEIISLLDYGFCYNYGFNHNENNLKNYNSSVNENYNFAFGENCNFVKSFNYDFVNIESKNYNLSKIGNYNSLNGSCYDFWRIYFICDNLKDFLFNTKNQKKF